MTNMVSPEVLFRGGPSSVPAHVEFFTQYDLQVFFWHADAPVGLKNVSAFAVRGPAVGVTISTTSEHRFIGVKFEASAVGWKNVDLPKTEKVYQGLITWDDFRTKCIVELPKSWKNTDR